MNELFAKDFIKLQSSIATMPKDKSGYGYKYTDLDTIISNLKPLLKAANIGFIQLLKTMYNDTGKTTGIETILLHSSGDSISSFVEIPEIQVGKANNAQNVGAAISYFKRYALAAAFGISSDEDIDCSSQALESHNRASQTAPTVKASSNNKSDTPKKNFNGKEKLLTIKTEKPAQAYTTEQATELGKVVNAQYENGESVFNDVERTKYRNDLKAGNYENAIEEARDILNRRLDEYEAKVSETLAAEVMDEQ